MVIPWGIIALRACDLYITALRLTSGLAVAMPNAGFFGTRARHAHAKVHRGRVPTPADELVIAAVPAQEMVTRSLGPGVLASRRLRQLWFRGGPLDRSSQRGLRRGFDRRVGDQRSIAQRPDRMDHGRR